MQGIAMTPQQIKCFLLYFFIKGMNLKGARTVAGIKEGCAERIRDSLDGRPLCHELKNCGDIDIFWALHRTEVITAVYPTAAEISEDESAPVTIARHDQSDVDYQRYLILREEHRLTTGQVYAIYVSDCAKFSRPPVSTTAFYKQIRKLRLKFNEGKEDLAYMAMQYRYGEQIQIDWCGKTVMVSDSSGNPVKCQVFVMVWPASGYTFVTAMHAQTTADTIKGLNAGFKKFDMLPKIVVCDNAKAIIDRHTSKGEVKVNRAMELYFQKIGVGLAPAAPRRPTHKSIAEHTVRLTQDRVLPLMAEYEDLELDAFNQVLQEKVDELINDTPFRSSGNGSTRKALFENFEYDEDRRPPEDMPVILSSFTKTVPSSYLIKFEEHYYSVPYEYIGEKVDVIVTADTIEIMKDLKLLALHKREDISGVSMNEDHMPYHHLVVSKSLKARLKTPEAVLEEAQKQSAVLAKFCESRLSRGDTQAINTCIRVIEFYLNAPFKQEADQAILAAFRTGKIELSTVQEAYKNILEESRMENAEPSSDEGAAPAQEAHGESTQSGHVADDPNFSSIRIKSDEDINKIASQVRSLEDAGPDKDKDPGGDAQTDDEGQSANDAPAMTNNPEHKGN